MSFWLEGSLTVLYNPIVHVQEYAARRIRVTSDICNFFFFCETVCLSSDGSMLPPDCGIPGSVLGNLM